MIKQSRPFRDECRRLKPAQVWGAEPTQDCTLPQRAQKAALAGDRFVLG